MMKFMGTKSVMYSKREGKRQLGRVSFRFRLELPVSLAVYRKKVMHEAENKFRMTICSLVDVVVVVAG